MLEETLKADPLVLNCDLNGLCPSPLRVHLQGQRTQPPNQHFLSRVAHPRTFSSH